ncbi:UDP-glucose--hexose-1-phosphate uridylyltransferase [Christiangramia sabulilitoris]|uniref:Galactose-1-phosphate uridylyltransferase n=1 Tax=Christiangramia sabulilitoris TaxID=2583991 RepID=A0A550I2L7_9FLAO|nr:UDP-glucose--hexose-1-phosphate uridylyltransferase [Christiangramia sabulilitoris]TRO65217.1 UDP-glucose--hexose-1-phosphate uridylyltransferase [Christiangramia sabulilitoris]
MNSELNNIPHKRYNILTGEWILVSPHRTKRPWQGKTEENKSHKKETYDPSCYLCPGNTRASGETNPDYKEPYSFINDFSSLLPDSPEINFQEGLLKAESERGICKVVCFSPDHSHTLPLMEVEDITRVVQTWKKEYLELGAEEDINYVQIFENKGAIMGCSNPHPHGQIWSQSSIPTEILKKSSKFREYWEQHKKSILSDYLEQELEAGERILDENEHFVSLIPYWAVWPFEAMIIPKRHLQHIGQLNEAEEEAYAEIIKKLTIKYDNLFETFFPYSSGIHQIPTDGKDYPEWHFHMSFYPPLLRSATVKKFMVGYEMFAGPQRDITAEQAAARLNDLSPIHYSLQ